MKTGTTYCPQPLVVPHSRLTDYLELTKPRVGVLVLFTVVAGAWLAGPVRSDIPAIFHALVGTALVVAGASALNQWLERDSDALMQRTENRPLPAGRLLPAEVATFGALLGAAGVVYLLVAVPQPLAGVIAGVAFISYVFLYTPLKRKTTLNTLVGAVPGALPPIIGWAAVRGSVGYEAVVLFVILFLWQVPHFLAIAWIYRDDYARAGLFMLPVLDRGRGITGRQMIGYCLALIPVSLMPAALGVAGPLYAIGAVILGLVFLGSALAFARQTSVAQARRVLRVSLIYLPALLALLLADSLGTTRQALALWP
jgi:protoheme IX farnesyltransferase